MQQQGHYQKDIAYNDHLWNYYPDSLSFCQVTSTCLTIRGVKMRWFGRLFLAMIARATCQSVWKSHLFGSYRLTVEIFEIQLKSSWSTVVPEAHFSNIPKVFHVTSSLWGEFTGLRWIPLTKASNAPVPLSRMLSANQYELAFVAHRTVPYWFELLRISSLTLSY